MPAYLDGSVPLEGFYHIIPMIAPTTFLSASEDNKVFISPIEDNSGWQRWKLLRRPDKSFCVVSSRSNQFLSTNPTGHVDTWKEVDSDRQIWNFKPRKDGGYNIIVGGDTLLVTALSSLPDGKVVLERENEEPQLVWKIVAAGLFHVNVAAGMADPKRKLLSATPSAGMGIWTNDDKSGRMVFILEPAPHGLCHIKVLGGVPDHKIFLSAHEDGKAVDLWNQDDKSGRQLWKVEEIKGKPGFFHIIISGGVKSDRVFLSAHEDGSAVDLWNADDNSGRQQWQLNRILDIPAQI